MILLPTEIIEKANFANNRGRPTKYRKKYCNLVPYLDYCGKNELLPSKTGYALYIGVSREVLDDWEQRNSDFLRTTSVLKQIQKHCLVNGGLNNKINPTITKLLLGANHGIIERQQLDTPQLASSIMDLVLLASDKREELDDNRRKQIESSDITPDRP